MLADKPEDRWPEKSIGMRSDDVNSNAFNTRSLDVMASKNLE